MDAPFFLVDSFSHAPFTGNPAGVCLCESEPSESWMARVGAEINQAETAFVWPKGDVFGLRWFTPTVEVDLCGHATLASAHAIFGLDKSDKTYRTNPGEEIHFETKSGRLKCSRSGDEISMDFPSEKPWAVNEGGLALAIGIETVWEGKNRMDWFCEIASEQALLSFVPDISKIDALGLRGMVVTAKSGSQDKDFVSRFFAPQSGVDEDFVTGSAHCALAPYWAEKLGRVKNVGFQASRRGGFVRTEVRGDRTILSGKARTVVSGMLSC